MVEGRKTSGLFGGALALGVSTPAGGLLTRGQDHSLDTGLQDGDVEVLQQPQRYAGGLQIGYHVSDVDGKDLRNRLELHDQLAGDQQVQLGLAYGTRAVADRDRYLAARRRSSGGSAPGREPPRRWTRGNPAPGRDAPRSQPQWSRGPGRPVQGLVPC